MNIHELKNFNTLPLSVRVLLTLISLADEQGKIRTTLPDLVRYLGASRQSVSSHIKNFVNVGALKWRYSGSARLNPLFYYTGNPSELNNVAKEFEQFKSDMKAE